MPTQQLLPCYLLNADSATHKHTHTPQSNTERDVVWLYDVKVFLCFFISDFC